MRCFGCDWFRSKLMSWNREVGWGGRGKPRTHLRIVGRAQKKKLQGWMHRSIHGEFTLSQSRTPFRNGHISELRGFPWISPRKTQVKDEETATICAPSSPRHEGSGGTNLASMRTLRQTKLQRSLCKRKQVSASVDVICCVQQSSCQSR